MRRASVIFILTFASVSSSFVFGQVTSSTSSNPALTPEIVRINEARNKILLDAGVSFRNGLQAFKDNKWADAGHKFDNSVETFLYSAINVQRDQKLESCYNQLIETVYRIEFPNSTQPPKIRELSATCSWNWNNQDFKLADQVVFLVEQIVSKASLHAPALSGSIADLQFKGSFEGFNEQQFKPSPLDELSKLELTPDDLRAESVVISNRLRPERQIALGGIKIVRAQMGDTVWKIADRYGADPIEVARYNGLLPNSVLRSGREMKIPESGLQTNSSVVYSPSLTPLLTENCAGLLSPTVQNLNLGLTTASVSSRIKGKLAIKRIPYSKAAIYYASFAGRRGLRKMYLGFYESKLYRIDVRYDDSVKWKGLAEFQKAVSLALALPVSWQDNHPYRRTIACKEFELTVSRTEADGYSLLLEDPRVYGDIYRDIKANELKLEKEQERKKRDFKP